jgi:hypothetical protein
MKTLKEQARDYAFKKTGPNPFPDLEAEKFWYCENRASFEGFEAGYKLALEHAAQIVELSLSNSRYVGLHYRDAVDLIANDIRNLTKEENGKEKN